MKYKFIQINYSNRMNQNQTSETTQLANNSQQTLNLNAPTTNQPYLVVNPNNNPQFNQNFNPQFNPIISPQINPVISPVIKNNPKLNIQIENKIPKVEIKTKRSFINVDFGPESKRMVCPHCDELIDTKTKISMNMKALLTAIATCYIGFVVMQACNKKAISFDDCEHTCPNCGITIGTYYAM